MRTPDEVIDYHVKIMQEEIDFSILADVLCDIGWIKVVLKPMTGEHGAKIDYWVQRYVNGEFKTLGLVWLFKEPKDATMFILKWSS